MSAAPSAPPLRPRRPPLSPLALGLLLWLGLALATAALLWRERQQALQQARLSAATLTALMEEHTARTFETVDVVLEALARDVDASLPRHDAGQRARMQAQLRHLPSVRALFVIGADGFIRHDTDYPKTPDVSLADRDYFRLHRDRPAGEVAINGPIMSRTPGAGWFVAVTRRIGAPGDAFQGVVVAAVQLRYFSELYRRMGLGPGQTIALFHRDGRLIARFPPDDAAIGRTYADFPLFREHLPRSPAGTYATAGPPTGVPRLFSYRALPALPLVVTLSQERDAILAPWRRTVASALLALAALLVILLVSARLLQQRRLAHALVRTDRAKNAFLATLSHELRNQLAPMQHGVRALELARDRPDVLARALPAMKRQVEHMGHLLDDLLDLARIGSGRIELARRRLDLGPVVQAAADANEPLLKAAGLRFERELPAAPLWAEVDPTRLSQVLANLLGNAAKYTPDGGLVRLSLRAEGADALIEVADDGEGIPAEALGRVFEMFEQVDAQRDQARGGLGIGLALVQRLVALHGGGVSVHSDGPGRGSRFSVRLPLAPHAA